MECSVEEFHCLFVHCANLFYLSSFFDLVLFHGLRLFPVISFQFCLILKLLAQLVHLDGDQVPKSLRMKEPKHGHMSK